MVGYLEVAMKLGRSVTLGGFAGLLKDRTWDKIADELEVGQEEIFAIPIKANGLFNVGTVLQVPEDKFFIGKGKMAAFHVRLNIEESGICYDPGSVTVG